MKGAIVAYNPCCECENKKMCQMCEITYYRHILESDIALPVIRCGECRFNVNNMEADPLCLNDYTGADIVCAYWESDGLAAQDFCSYGERRSDGA